MDEGIRGGAAAAAQTVDADKAVGLGHKQRRSAEKRSPPYITGGHN